MAKKPHGLPRVDYDALVRSVALFKRLSPRASAELSATILRDGWRAGAYYAARRLQQISLGLTQFEAAPCELKPQTIAPGVRDIWMADPTGVDQHRAKTVMVLRQLQHLKLSRFEPSPLRAIEIEQQRRAELGMQTDGAA
jgi:hypothetical protein